MTNQYQIKMEQEQQKPKTGTYAIKYGLILGVISVIIAMMLYSMDMHYQQDWKVGVISMIIMIVVIVMAQLEFKKDNNGYMSLGQALKVGVGLSLIAGIIGVIFNQVLMHLIDPDTMQKALEYQRQQMAAAGMSSGEIDNAMEMGKGFRGSGMQIAIGLIGSLFLGFIFSLISGLAIKKTEPEN